MGVIDGPDVPTPSAPGDGKNLSLPDSGSKASIGRGESDLSGEAEEKPVKASGFRHAFLSFCKDVETVSKPIAILLAVIGLIATYIPNIKRQWELTINPASFFEVGTIKQISEGRLYTLFPNSYDNAAWTNGFNPDDLFALKGKVIVTNGTAVGRNDSDIHAAPDSVLTANKCLFVEDIVFRKFKPPAPEDNDKKSTCANRLALRLP